MHIFWWECHTHALGVKIFKFKQNIIFAWIVTKVLNSLVIFTIHILFQYSGVTKFIILLGIIKIITINITHPASIIRFQETAKFIMFKCISHEKWHAMGVFIG